MVCPRGVVCPRRGETGVAHFGYVRGRGGDDWFGRREDKVVGDGQETQRTGRDQRTQEAEPVSIRISGQVISGQQPCDHPAWRRLLDAGWIVPAGLRRTALDLVRKW